MRTGSLEKSTRSFAIVVDALCHTNTRNNKILDLLAIDSDGKYMKLFIGSLWKTCEKHALHC